MRSLWALIAALVFAPSPLVAGDLSSVVIRDVPHVRQKPDFCGEACAEMFLRNLGSAADQDYVFDQSGLDPLLGRGCYTRELVLALKRIGFATGPVWSKVAVRTADAELNRDFEAMHADLVAGVPSVICMRTGTGPDATEHFRLILGYDADSDEVLYHEPAEANGAYRRIARDEFLSLWPLKYAADSWTLVRMRLEPANLSAVTVTEGFTNADYAQHIRELRKKLPHEGFSIVIQPPFVVVGDEPLETVKKRAEGTIRWAVEHIKKDYFAKDPDAILDIWLFRDNPSYEEHNVALFGRKPSTPYGFYSPRHGALVMNISTGGGTLVHEIVHPFMASNFPECPSWFNEGLASLYEQSSHRDGHIIGLTNWRLAGLQRAIERGTVPSFETLCSTTTSEFYDEDPGTNYAQARYLCYYLQERGLLVKYFHTFRKNAGKDPTGVESLKAVLGEKNLDAFQQQWHEYVLGLRFEN